MYGERGEGKVRGGKIVGGGRIWRKERGRGGRKKRKWGKGKEG